MQSEAELMVMDWERVGNRIIGLQKDFLVINTQSKVIIGQLQLSDDIGNEQLYFDDDSLSYDMLIDSLKKSHNYFVALQDSTNNLYKKYSEERKMFHLYHRKLKYNEIPKDKVGQFNITFKKMVNDLDNRANTIKRELMQNIENYNYLITAIAESSASNYQLTGYKLKIR
jgi:hypothetical protein